MAINYFFALAPSAEARTAIHQFAEEWRGMLNMRSVWYAPDDYHVTLKFLGNFDDARLPRVIETAAPVAEQTRPFTLSPASPGGFPDMRAPSVLWSGVQISPQLDILATQLDNALVALGFRAERQRYQPHITVARCRLRTTHLETTANGSEPVDWPLPNERPFAEFQVDQFFLMQTLTQEQRAKEGKARYNTVHTFPFGKAAP